MGQLGFYTGFIGNATAVVSWVDWGISPPFLYNFISQINQEALLSQRGRAMLRVCIASIQNVERSLLSLVISASEYHCVQLNSFLFSSFRRIRPCCRPSQKHSLVRRRLSDLYCMVVGNCFCHFVVRTSSNRSTASGAWPTVIYSASSSVNVFGTSHVQQSSIASY